jgi:DUF2075 family protein
MLVYIADKLDFRADVRAGAIEEKIIAALGHRVSPNEIRSWRNSLLHMSGVLEDADIPQDVGVGIELRIPLTSKRIDLILSGYDADHTAHAVIIELKQWESATLSTRQNMVRTRLGGYIQDVLHPSYQAWSYSSLLATFNEAVYSGQIQLHPCASLHNYENDDVIRHSSFQELTDIAPVFTRRDTDLLAEFIKKHIQRGDKKRVLFEMQEGRIRPSPVLADSVVSMLRGVPEFVLIDEQRIAYETIKAVAKNEAITKKQVVIVHGGPGTGKSVIALTLLAELTAERRMASYTTRNLAPRDTFKAMLKAGGYKKVEIHQLFKSAFSYADMPADTYDIIMADEAHRLTNTADRFSNSKNQIQEIINASRTSVFFLDEDQRVTYKDAGSREFIIGCAGEVDAEVSEVHLVSQFRCSGSDGYLAWINDVIGISETANQTLNEIDYDFQVFDSPAELNAVIRDKNSVNGKSRLVAGYCWEWISQDDSSKVDIVIPQYDFAMPWNMIDRGYDWLIRPETINQVGCIHTCQGLELDYIGVIIGPDLLVRGGVVMVDPSARAEGDHSLKGYKTHLKMNQIEANMKVRAIIQNTYRTLMTRGMKGCYIWSEDEETREWFRGRIGVIPKTI